MEDNLVNPEDPYGDDVLAHFGVKGMKWGVRRLRRGGAIAGGAAKAYLKGARGAQKRLIKGVAKGQAKQKAFAKGSAKAAVKGVKKLQSGQKAAIKGGAKAAVKGVKKLQSAQIATAKKELAVARAAGGAVKKLQGKQKAALKGGAKAVVGGVKKLQGAQIKTGKKIVSTTVGGVKKLQGKQKAILKAEVKLAKSVHKVVAPKITSALKTIATQNSPTKQAALAKIGHDNALGYTAAIGKQAVSAYATGIVVGSVLKSVINTVRIVT